MSASDTAQELAASLCDWLVFKDAFARDTRSENRTVGAAAQEIQATLDTQFYAQLRATAGAVCELCGVVADAERIRMAGSEEPAWEHCWFDGEEERTYLCDFSDGWEFWFNLRPTKGGSDDAE